MSLTDGCDTSRRRRNRNPNGNEVMRDKGAKERQLRTSRKRGTAGADRVGATATRVCVSVILTAVLVFVAIVPGCLPGHEGRPLVVSGFVCPRAQPLERAHQSSESRKIRPTVRKIPVPLSPSRNDGLSTASTGTWAVGSSATSALIPHELSPMPSSAYRDKRTRLTFHCCTYFVELDTYRKPRNSPPRLSLALMSTATEEAAGSGHAFPHFVNGATATTLTAPIDHERNGEHAPSSMSMDITHSSSRGRSITADSTDSTSLQLNMTQSLDNNDPSSPSDIHDDEDESNVEGNVDKENDIPKPTPNGGFTHTNASKAKISAANKGKTPWNKGRSRSEEERARISAGVRARNRERFLQKLQRMGLSEEEYERKKKEERRTKEAERKARRTARGGYRPTDETKRKISQILKDKWARGEVKKRTIHPDNVRRGFSHSEETKRKIRETLKRRWATDAEYRANQTRKSTSANTSPDARRKISDSLKKKWRDPLFRRYMLDRISQRKAPSNSHGTDHRAKISAAMKAKWKDESYRMKILRAMDKKRREGTGAMPSSPSKTRRPADPSSSPGTGEVKKSLVTKTTTATTTRRVENNDGVVLVLPLRPRKKSARKKKSTTSRMDSDGTEVIKKKKGAKQKKKKKKKIDEDGHYSSGTAEAVRPLTKPNKMSGMAASAQHEPEPEGSISRLREERRDLYDLLYGDDDDIDHDNDDVMRGLDPNDDGDDRLVTFGQGGGGRGRGGEFVSSSLSSHNRGRISNRRSYHKDGIDDREEEGESIAGASPFAFSRNDDVDDENLDDFDPYGLEDF